VLVLTRSALRKYHKRGGTEFAVRAVVSLMHTMLNPHAIHTTWSQLSWETPVADLVGRSSDRPPVFVDMVLRHASASHAHVALLGYHPHSATRGAIGLHFVSAALTASAGEQKAVLTHSVVPLAPPSSTSSAAVVAQDTLDDDKWSVPRFASSSSRGGRGSAALDAVFVIFPVAAFGREAGCICGAGDSGRGPGVLHTQWWELPLPRGATACALAATTLFQQDAPLLALLSPADVACAPLAGFFQALRHRGAAAASNSLPSPVQAKAGRGAGRGAERSSPTPPQPPRGSEHDEDLDVPVEQSPAPITVRAAVRSGLPASLP